MVDIIAIMYIIDIVRKLESKLLDSLLYVKTTDQSWGRVDYRRKARESYRHRSRLRWMLYPYRG